MIKRDYTSLLGARPLSPIQFIKVATAALAFTQLATVALNAGEMARGKTDHAAISGRWKVAVLQQKAIVTPAGDISFEPADGSISGATSCNFFRGNYKISDGPLEIKVGMMTRRACFGDAADHESAFLEALSKTAAYRINADRLTLTATDGTALAELVRAVDAALEGVDHKIVSYLKDGGLYSVRAETGAAITLKQGRIEGRTGCRPFTASYTRKGDALSISNVVPAQIFAPCAENVRDQDKAILSGLPDATTFDTSRNLIRLLKEPGGSAILWITPQTP